VVDESDWASGRGGSKWFRKGGKPTGITFIGNLYGEGKLLALAKAYQDATELARPETECRTPERVSFSIIFQLPEILF
jgi:hypothetical protein